MKDLETTFKKRAYSEEEAKEFLNTFIANAREKGYTVGTNGYKYKCKKAKGEIVAEAWICTCTAIYNDVWDEGDI